MEHTVQYGVGVITQNVTLHHSADTNNLESCLSTLYLHFALSVIGTPCCLWSIHYKFKLLIHTKTFLEKLEVPQLDEKFFECMEADSSSPIVQQPVTCTYAESHQLVPLPHSISWITVLILSFHLICVFQVFPFLHIFPCTSSLLGMRHVP
jgi:hypothetical protein